MEWGYRLVIKYYFALFCNIVVKLLVSLCSFHSSNTTVMFTLMKVALARLPITLVM